MPSTANFRLHGVYAHPEDLKSIDVGTEKDTDDHRFIRYCIEASRDFETLAGGRIFLPRRYVRYFDHPHYEVSVSGGAALMGYGVHELKLKDDLIEVVSFKTNNDATTLTSSDYFLMSGDDYHSLPANKVVMSSSGSTTLLTYTSTPQAANSIDAYWGYIPHWLGSAWVDTNQTITSLSGNTLTVSDVSDIADDYDSSFKTLSLLKFTDGTDTEFMLVKSINGDNNTIQVTRAVNGSTQVTASGGETLSVFRPDDGITKAVRRLAVWYYRQRSASNPDADRVVITPGGVVAPPGFPPDVKEAAMSYRDVFR